MFYDILYTNQAQRKIGGNNLWQKPKAENTGCNGQTRMQKNSNSTDDLDPSFKTGVKNFIKALQDAGATVTVSTTKRSDKRAYLFHWSWKISQGKCKAKDATAKAGVDIEWDHGDDAKSKQGALEMVNGFGLAVPPNSTNPPSLTSNHISGKAIDMTIEWTGKIKVKKQDGKEVKVNYMDNVNANTTLHGIGASYGVKKLTTDAPHWSFNGR
jgi:hypothetical protein